LKEAGAGLGVGSNALKAMRQLGLEEKLLQKSLVLSGMNLVNDQGRLITTTDSTKGNAGLESDNMTIHRADLLHLLADALRIDCVQTDKRCVGFTRQPEDRIMVRFHDGTSAEADGLIAADGIRSTIRHKLAPAVTPRYAGYTCWRAVVADVPDGMVDPVFTAVWGSKGRFGFAPLQGNRVYWFACLNAAPQHPAYAGFRTKELMQRFASYPAPIAELLERTDDEAVLHNDIHDLKPLDRFAYGSVVLVGDAAHATTPNLAQGAAQAMEDAIVLAHCLKAYPLSVEEAFCSFEQLRLARTRRVVETSWRLGKVAQLESKLLCSARNGLFRALPAWVSERQLRFLRDVAASKPHSRVFICRFLPFPVTGLPGPEAARRSYPRG
jgi:FAD-dependent urate hydroxylase